MRIQHNIMAMNAYRNYTNNVSALKSNLEKLSSGYKINRAGDDAAGLAISEKMRAQITGLETAQKNAKDGISLVQTGEGALTEVHDMLNRMVELATQSANGTYDNTTDRAQMQKEIDQLKSEINRIADSANFNGIKLLDGSMDADGRVASTTTQFNDMIISSNCYGKAADGTTSISNNKGGLDLTGVNVGSTDTELNASDKSVRYHKDAAVAGKTSFTVDLDGTTNGNFSAGTTISGLVFGLDANQTVDNTATGAKNNAVWLSATGTTATDRLTYDVTSDNDGITSENIAKSIMESIDKAGGKVYITVGDDANAANQVRIEYNVTRDGDKLKFEMTDKGYNDAAAAALDTNKAGNYFQGNFNVGLNYKATANITAGNETTFTNFVNGETMHPATSNINEGTTPAGTIYAEALIRFDATSPANATANDGINNITKFFADGAGVKLGDDYYVFAKSDEVLNGEYADNVHVVDIRDLEKLGTTTDNTGDELRKALDRLSVAAKDNEMFDVQVAKAGNALVVTERTTYTGGANLTEKDSGLESQIQKFDSTTSKTTVTKEAGKALTLQIGDTAEDFNQLKVNIKDIHTSSLGLEDLRVDNQISAAAAVDKIKAAINMVSDIRGTLGATQNRLDHTINNLSVMTENIQDAESTIRDTDVASEMMKYTKNNILIQSAQAMLAQANQVPQGVLQLLQ